MLPGDYDNAALLLIKAREQSPNDLEISKDLALNYYFQKENIKALEVIKPMLDRTDADDQSFQIAGNIYKMLDQFKEGDAMYKRGIKRFPKSGALYNEYGELLSFQQDAGAIAEWEKGIEMDPGYPGNYYNASKFYYFTTDKIWSVLYGEMFLNLEPLSGRTAEIKSLLFDSYKKLLSGDVLNGNKNKNKFEQAYLQTLSKQDSLIEGGINPENLIMLRTRFILDWYQNYATQFPFKLFEYQHQLLGQGIFEAYNQWIFGPAQNLTSYQNWTSEHATEYADFSNFQKGRIFKIPANQYYHK
jgi:tetratricopeptide (TPR) repeat protein